MSHTEIITSTSHEVFIPHLGWLLHAPDEELARSLNEGWFEYREQAFCWLYLQEGGTVIDCGAHIGLFSVLAGRLVGAEGRVVSVEPHPETSAILEQNLGAHRVASARAVRAAVSDRRGVASLALGTAGRAAYTSLLAIEGTEQRVEVPTLTLDELVAAHQINKIDLLKLDVEGVEIDALAGARQLLADRRVQVLLVEFTEENLNRGGRSTADLRDAITDAGYALCRFDDENLGLQPATVAAPIAYENLFAIPGPADSINDRLRRAPADRRRVAQQIIRRGRACEKLRTARVSVADLRRLLDGCCRTSERRASRIQAQEQTMGILKRQLDGLQAEIAQLRQEYRQIKSSRSWRYTRPFRGLTEVAARLSRGH